MTAFPDMVVKTEEVRGHGSHVIFPWIWTGTNTRSPVRWSVCLAAVLAGLLLVVSCDRSVPKPDGRVTDLANLLSPKEKRDLDRRLADYERRTTHQLAVLTVASLHGEGIDEFSMRVAKAWALGQKGVDNGVLVTVAPAERRVRIELGQGMSRFITDAETKEIIETSMIPAFRRGRYAEGLNVGIDRIMELGLRYRGLPRNEKT